MVVPIRIDPSVTVRNGQESQLTLAPALALNTSSCICSLLSQPLLPGSEYQLQSLLTRYGPGKLYQVTSDINGTGPLDLTLPRGQIVALLQNKDTKGNSSRWLVDTGGMWTSKLFIPFWESQLPRADREAWMLVCANLAVQTQETGGQRQMQWLNPLTQWYLKCQ